MPEPRPTLPLRAFVNELGLAFKKLSFYPANHPSRARAVDEALGIARSLSAPTGELALGVEKGAFMAAGESLAVESAQALVTALYTRRVAVVRFLEHLTAAELEGFLLVLRPDPGAEESAISDLSLPDELNRQGISGIRIEEVDYTGVVATEDLTDLLPTETSLWHRILHLQIAGKPLGSDDERSAGSMDRVVSALNRRFPGLFDPSGDGRSTDAEAGQLVGLLAEAIEDQLGEAVAGGEDAFVLRQVTDFLAAIPGGLRQPLLEAALGRLASAETGGGQFERLSASISAADLVTTLRNLRDTGRRFSPAAVAVIERVVLGSPESGSPSHRAPKASSVGSLDALVETDPLGDDRHPMAGIDDFALSLPRCPEQTVEPPADFDDSLASLAPAALMGSLLPTLLTLLARPNLTGDEATGIAKRLETLFDDLVRSGRLTAASALLQHLEATMRRRSDAVGAALAGSYDTLTGAHSVPLLLETFQAARAESLDEVKSLVRTLGPSFRRNTLLVLGETEDRRTRRELFDFLRTVLSETIVADARALLSDERWYVVRNMIALLAAVEDRTSLSDLRRCLEHDDARVRVEAAKSLARLDQNLSPDLVAKAIDSGDEQVAGVLVRAAGERGGQAAIGPLIAILQPLDPVGRTSQLRIRALESLGEIGSAEVLPKIRRYFRQFAPVDNLEVRRAAFRSLAGYPVAARTPWVKKGLRSRDREIRAVCQTLSTGGRNG